MYYKRRKVFCIGGNARIHKWVIRYRTHIRISPGKKGSSSVISNVMIFAILLW